MRGFWVADFEYSIWFLIQFRLEHENLNSVPLWKVNFRYLCSDQSRMRNQIENSKSPTQKSHTFCLIFQSQSILPIWVMKYQCTVQIMVRRNIQWYFRNQWPKEPLWIEKSNKMSMLSGLLISIFHVKLHLCFDSIPIGFVIRLSL